MSDATTDATADAGPETGNPGRAGKLPAATTQGIALSLLYRIARDLADGAITPDDLPADAPADLRAGAIALAREIRTDLSLIHI